MHALIVSEFGILPRAETRAGLALALMRGPSLPPKPVLLAMLHTASGGLVGVAAAAITGHPVLWIAVGLGLGVALDRITGQCPEQAPAAVTSESAMPHYGLR